MLERKYLQVGIKELQDIIKCLPLKIKEFEFLTMFINYLLGGCVQDATKLKHIDLTTHI